MRAVLTRRSLRSVRSRLPASLSLALALIAPACTTGSAAEPTPAVSPAPELSGDAVAHQVCTHCHSFESALKSPNELAPNLAGYGTRGPFNPALRALVDAGDPEWLDRWISDPPSVRPGTAMPPQNERAGGRLSDETIRRVVEYVLSLK